MMEGVPKSRQRSFTLEKTQEQHPEKIVVIDSPTSEGTPVA